MHIGFCIAPFPGHVNPSLALVSELARRGHRVSYATSAEFSQAVRAAGGRAVVYDTTGPPRNGQTTRPPGGNPAGADVDFARSLSGQLRELGAVLPVLIPAFAQDPPEVVICDPMSWAGRALAGRYRAPAINSITTMITKPSWSLGSIGASFNPAHPRLPQLLAATSALLAHYETGLTAAHLLGTAGEIPAIAYHPRAFEPQGDQFGPDVHFVGPCLPGRPSGRYPADGHGPAGAGPLILISLGTVFNRQPALFRRCIDAFAELSCRVVLALGGLPASTLGPLPPNVRAHDYVSLPAVLPGTDVFVGHAGMTSTMEALSFGVPITALPQMPEQRLNAGRLAELGLGLCLDRSQQTAAGVLGAVTALLHDPGIGSRLAWMRGEIERAPGARAAAEVIENASSHAHEPHPDPAIQLPGAHSA